jgi:hypothetical protein
LFLGGERCIARHVVKRGTVKGDSAPDAERSYQDRYRRQSLRPIHQDL